MDMEMRAVAMPHICQPPFVMDKEIHAQNPLTYKKSHCEIVAELGAELCFHLGTGARQGNQQSVWIYIPISPGCGVAHHGFEEVFWLKLNLLYTGGTFLVVNGVSRA